jgi:CheY-like chemotaxis protein
VPKIQRQSERAVPFRRNVMDPGKRCLFVAEDDADLHLLFARVAEREVFRVDSAQSGDQALLALKKLGKRVDALLTDIRLPGHIDGWALGQEFTRLYPDASVIYVSGVEADQAQRGPNSLFPEKLTLAVSATKTDPPRLAPLPPGPALRAEPFPAPPPPKPG